MADIERKLTTILICDVVGFRKMMGVDEAGTLATLRACRGLIDASIENITAAFSAALATVS